MEKQTLFKIFSILLILSISFYFAGCSAPSAPQPEPNFNPAPINNTYPSGPSQPQEPTYPAPKPIEIHFINVGLGDATLIRSEGSTILFDTGPDLSADKVKAYLKKNGIKQIDLLILSSSDPAFSSGALELMQSFPTKWVWTSGDNSSAANWQQTLQLAKNSNLTFVEYGRTFHEGNFSLTVLNPFPGYRNSNPAMDSIVLKAEYGKFCAVLFSNSEASGASGADPGTVAGGVDSRIISSPISVKCPVLKVSHHGSGNSASFQFLNTMAPEMAVISVGANPPENKYPEPTTIRRLLLKNVEVYTTDRLGDIVVSSYGFGYDVSSEYLRNEAYAIFIDGVGNGGQLYWR